ncbi:MAG: hypothetical protein JOY82_22110 [Streptosporangiaceae bacterium]|nr:hypothetical protein [Streptosporangiaceae bacterium]MBV9857179.1 hypothetical protein [Streptosporangiaceae bacterium]
MPHVSSPALRRLVDEPMAVPDRARRHLAGCDRCQAARSEIAENAATAARLVGAPGQARDVDLEWILLAGRLRQPNAVRRPVIRSPWRMPRRLVNASLSTPAAVGAAVVAVGVGAAAALTSVYAPTRVVPVHVSPNDVQAIENLTGLNVSQLLGGLTPSGSRKLAFGDLSWTSSGQAQRVNSIARASALTHLAYSAPASLPAGVGSPSSIAVQPKVTATVTFSRNAGPGIAGSTLEITGGPAIVVQYGGRPGVADLTTLAIAVMERPTASSADATASQLEAFLLSRPGLPSGLAQEVRLLGNPGTALPVPVPPGVSARQLTIGGTSAVLLTEPAGVASGVIWESRDGVVHGVAGLLDPKDVVDVARQVG